MITKNTYKHTVIKESRIATMEEFIENIKVLTNTLGFKVLEPKESIETTKPEEKQISEKLYLNINVKNVGKITAYGEKTKDGFIVKKGSQISPICTNSISKNLVTARESANIVDNILQEDSFFSSSSTAGGFCTGHSCDGPMVWKTEKGIPLKNLL